jgi:type III pantothenate kinase
LRINYNPPESVGIDRLINASAAASKYGTPVVVCSFGTATVIDVVSREREFLGGIIAPGVKTMAAALRENTAQLRVVEIEQPPSLIGNSTEAAILSGIVNGHIAMAEGLLERITGTRTPPSAMSAKRETPSAASGVADGGVRVPKVIATGGFANLIASKIDAVTKIDENLTLDGPPPPGCTKPKKVRQLRQVSGVAVGRYFGARRAFVSCSNAYANLMSGPSLHARPKNEIPIGSSRAKPAGTVMLG